MVDSTAVTDTGSDKHKPACSWPARPLAGRAKPRAISSDLRRLTCHSRTRYTRIP